MALGEFDIIARYFSDIGLSDVDVSGVELGVGDDCALVAPIPESQAISIDTQVCGVHFPLNAEADLVAERALRCAVSDLAAMGAEPWFFTLALTTPTFDEPWMRDFSRGLRRAAGNYKLALIGGDTTRGPLTVTLQVHGKVPATMALRRDKAAVGDAIFVSGDIGAAALALQVFEQKIKTNTEDNEFILARYYQPVARIDLGLALRGVATAAIDISDGLLADLGHIATASGVGATIFADRIPAANVLRRYLSPNDACTMALTGGDDYELCFTVPGDKRERIADIADRLALPLTDIGEVTAGNGVQCLDSSGSPLQLARTGYQHF